MLNDMEANKTFFQQLKQPFSCYYLVKKKLEEFEFVRDNASCNTMHSTSTIVDVTKFHQNLSISVLGIKTFQ